MRLESSRAIRVRDFAWDWSRYVGFAERQERILRLPYLERLTASAALNEELDHSWAVSYTHLTLPTNREV